LRVLPHTLAGFGERHDHVAAIIGIGLQRDDAQIDHLAQRAVNRLPGNAQVAGYVGRAHDPADDIGHDHRLRAIDVWPAAFVKARLKTFIEPAEALEQGDDKLVREHGECWKSRKFAALESGQIPQRHKSSGLATGLSPGFRRLSSAAAR
jgi:hypothetical protein